MTSEEALKNEELLKELNEYVSTQCEKIKADDIIYIVLNDYWRNDIDHRKENERPKVLKALGKREAEILAIVTNTDECKKLQNQLKEK